MEKYRISGVWKDSDNVITHYAFHTVFEKTTSRASKKTKDEAIQVLERNGNTATTWIWNYNKSGWEIGEKVEVINGGVEKYLRSNPNDKKTDNLGHLIDFDWINP